MTERIWFILEVCKRQNIHHVSLTQCWQIVHTAYRLINDWTVKVLLDYYYFSYLRASLDTHADGAKHVDFFSSWALLRLKVTQQSIAVQHKPVLLPASQHWTWPKLSHCWLWFLSMSSFSPPCNTLPWYNHTGWLCVKHQLTYHPIQRNLFLPNYWEKNSEPGVQFYS